MKAPGIPVRLVDSITELCAEDRGCIAISGSHGGISSARYAAAVEPMLSVFNDAGVGMDNAGIAALAILQLRGLAACTVQHQSARIGDSHSTLETGRISHVNELAATLGIYQGQSCRNAAMMVVSVRCPEESTRHEMPDSS